MKAVLVILIIIILLNVINYIADNYKNKKRTREAREAEHRRKTEAEREEIRKLLNQFTPKHIPTEAERQLQLKCERYDKIKILYKYKEEGYCEYEGELTALSIQELDKYIELARKREASNDKLPERQHTVSNSTAPSHSTRTVSSHNIFASLKQYHTSFKQDTPISDDRPRKVDWLQFKEYLASKNIRYFWHFTDRSNLASIKHRGGLYSWKYCKENGISIPKAGGTPLSRDLDTRYNLGDYVRVSFCPNHPMVYRLKQEGYNLVLLRIKIDVAYLQDTLFSDMNATDNDHKHGPSLDDLKCVDINATQEAFVARTSPSFRKHQAEVLVKNFIPIEYIENIDNPIQL